MAHTPARSSFRQVFYISQMIQGTAEVPCQDFWNDKKRDEQDRRVDIYFPSFYA